MFCPGRILQFHHRVPGFHVHAGTLGCGMQQVSQTCSGSITARKRSHNAGLYEKPYYFTIWLILKIGRMIAMAMKPTTVPMARIMMGSIMPVTALMLSLSCLA